jgi:hypothetical protein
MKILTKKISQLKITIQYIPKLHIISKYIYPKYYDIIYIKMDAISKININESNFYLYKYLRDFYVLNYSLDRLSLAMKIGLKNENIN